ncbi:MAG TPA: SURF1 family protein [Acidimicrobiales bacterium]|nr:SURF1 family protein [Acidimicrobiales bacterium]
MYRFALRPVWILSHLFAVASIVAFVLLGAWQLDRHDQRAERNETIEARAELPPVPVSEALAEVGCADWPDCGEAPADEIRFRDVSAEGTYGEDVLLVDNRSKDGLPGAWVLAPLQLDDGSVLVVNRGFQFNDSASGAIDPPPPPAGTVAVEGYVAVWEGGSCGVRTDDSGAPVGMACLREDTAEAVFGADVLPVVVQAQRSDPADADVLDPVPLPELGAGPHRSYAVQWFTFATLAAIVYPLILRRKAKGQRVEGATLEDVPG